jgi:hypothetical protein
MTAPGLDPVPEPGELRRLLDVEAVRDVVLRYCRGIDRMDLELVRSCYHPDATDDHGTFVGAVDEYLVWVERLLRRYDTTFHLIANHLVDVDGDVARSEAYGIARHQAADPDPRRNLTIGFRFLDRFERRQGQWRIARRVATTEWVEATPPESRWPVPDGIAVGRRDRSDPLYGMWADVDGHPPG